MSGKTKCRCVVVNYEQLSYHFIGTLKKKECNLVATKIFTLHFHLNR